MTKIDIFSGFLGAGKTTLIKKLISEAYKNEKLVLIENEFGDIGIDGAFMQESGIEITEMNSGCICCSLVGDFGDALRKVLKEFSPDRILIEPSGVGKLSDVITAVSSVTDENVSLNSYCAVVDAKKCKMYMKNFGEFFNNQIEHSSAIILSHTELSEEKLSECVKLIKEVNPTAPIVTTPWHELDGSEILKVLENEDFLLEQMKEFEHEHHHHEHGECDCHEHHHHEHDECDCHEHHHHEHGECDCHEHHHHEHGECDCHDHHHHEHGECDCHDHHHHEHGECDCHEHHHHADDVFTSWGIETVRSYTKDKLEEILSSLSDFSVFGTVLRAKGIVKGEDCWIHFDYVPGETDIRIGAASTTGRICVIGADIDSDRLEELFEV